jgi:predicted permease
MLTELETKLLGVLMMLIMFGMGASLTFRDFLIAFKKPKGVLVGLFCQYGIMPFLGYLFAVLLGTRRGDHLDGLHARRYHVKHLHLLQQRRPRAIDHDDQRVDFGCCVCGAIAA